MLEDINPELIRIRAHHLLCLQGFQGYGYNQEFTLRLGEIIQVLKSDPLGKIQIVTDADDICTNCPKLIGEQCVDHLKIEKMDSIIIGSISLVENQVIPIKTALQIIDTELSSETIKTVCEGCVWMDKCLFFINKLG